MTERFMFSFQQIHKGTQKLKTLDFDDENFPNGNNVLRNRLQQKFPNQKFLIVVL